MPAIRVVASQDIEKIWLYTYELWSIEQADRYFNLIMDEIHYLADNPKSGKDCGKVRKGYFRLRINHISFFIELTGRTKKSKLSGFYMNEWTLNMQLNN